MNANKKDKSRRVFIIAIALVFPICSAGRYTIFYRIPDDFHRPALIWQNRFSALLAHAP
jgi:hypothetical protein